MSRREPLSGWTRLAEPYRTWTHYLQIGVCRVWAGPLEWQVYIGADSVPAEVGVTVPTSLRDSLLGAEDAARRLVAAMAAALRGTVAWEGEVK